MVLSYPSLLLVSPTSRSVERTWERGRHESISAGKQMRDACKSEVVFLHSWPVVFPDEMSGKSSVSTIKTLGNGILRATSQIISSSNRHERSSFVFTILAEDKDDFILRPKTSRKRLLSNFPPPFFSTLMKMKPPHAINSKINSSTVRTVVQI